MSEIHSFSARWPAPGMKSLRLVVLIVAAALAFGAGAVLVITALGPSVPPESPVVVATPAPKLPDAERVAARAAIARKIAETPEITRFFDRLKLTLPGDFDTTLDALARKQTDGQPDRPDLWLSDGVKALRQARGALAAKADGTQLGRMFDLQLTVLKALAARDPRLCVDFLYGGASEAFYTFSSSNRPMVTDMAIAGLDAILDGQAKRIERGAPTDADFQMLEKALAAKGLTQPEIESLLDGKTADPPIDDARMCKAGQTYLEVLKSMPDAVRLRIYALAVELMARS